MIQLPRSLEATAQFIGGPEMRDVKSIARFPEPQYWNGNFALEIEGFGHGSSLAIATNRAFREIMSDPRMRYKCPKLIYLTLGADCLAPVPFWHFFQKS